MGTDAEKASGDAQKEVSDFTDVVGGNGRWQCRMLFLFMLMAMPCAWHNLSMSFLAPNVEFTCATSPQTNVSSAVPSVAETDDSDSNSQSCYTYEFSNSTTYPESNSNSSSDDVDLPKTNQALVPCTKWIFNDSFYTSTVVSQWNLVCDKSWMVSMTNSVLMFGFMTSVLVLGQVSDKIGRKPVMFGGAVILLLSGLTCAFSMSFIMFTISRFFIAFGAAGLFSTGFTFLMEVVSTESRSVYGVVCQFGWSAGYVILPAFAWFIRDWFWLQLALTVPCVALIACWWLLPESPRWLLSQGKTEKAEKILNDIARANKKDLQDINSSIKKVWPKSGQVLEKQKGNIFDLFRRGLWQKTLNLYFCWFVNSFIYYGLSFNTNDLAGNTFLNFAIAGAVEFPAYGITIFVIRSLGRRIPLMATMVAGGLACLLTVPLTGDLMWIRVPLSMFGKFCITASFGIIYVFTAEIFPTVVRNTGVGSSSTCARIGSILAPFVKELGHATHPAVPLACYGVLSIVSGVLILLLPETNRIKVPDTFEEAAACGKKPKPPAPEKPLEIQEPQKPCVVHEITEKVKPPTPTSAKPTSDGKKLPDLLEEPSVVDEAAEDNRTEEQESAVPELLPESEPEEPAVAENVELQETADDVREPKDSAAPAAHSASQDGNSSEPVQQTPL